MLKVRAVPARADVARAVPVRAPVRAVPVSFEVERFKTQLDHLKSVMVTIYYGRGM